MRTALQWVVFALVAYACWHVGPVYLSSRQFADALEEMARRSHGAPQDVVRQRTLELARAHALPLTEAGVEVRRVPNHTYVDVTYTADLQLLPGFTYPWTFTTTADGYVERPATATDVLGPAR